MTHKFNLRKRKPGVQMTKEQTKRKKATTTGTTPSAKRRPSERVDGELDPHWLTEQSKGNKGKGSNNKCKGRTTQTETEQGQTPELADNNILERKLDTIVMFL